MSKESQEFYNEDNLLKLADDLDIKLANQKIDIYEAAKDILKFCRSMTVKQRCGYNRFASGAAYILIQREKRKKSDCHPYFLSPDADNMKSVREFWCCPD